ncbi:MAG: BrnT family toxin [Planctomycetes bacterium]|nr:BrnT family toxin [Planctomycetota bacterium]
MRKPENATGFEWDAGNTGKNRKHDVTDAEAEQVFFCPDLLVVPDARHSEAEPRFHALGETLSGRMLHVTFTLRTDDTLIRVISARAMSRKERAIYETPTEDTA